MTECSATRQSTTHELQNPTATPRALQPSILQHRLKRWQSAVLQGSQPHMSCRTQQQLCGHSSPVNSCFSITNDLKKIPTVGLCNQTKKVFSKHRYKRGKKYNFTVKEKKITVSNIDMDKSTQFKKIVKDLMQCYTFLLMIIKPAVPKKNHILFRLSGHFPIFVHLICITRWGDLLDV